jgi:CxxC motif-containing protein
MAVMDALRGIVLENRVRCGDIVVSDISGTGCDIIATLDIP